MAETDKLNIDSIISRLLEGRNVFISGSRLSKLSMAAFCQRPIKNTFREFCFNINVSINAVLVIMMLYV